MLEDIIRTVKRIDRWIDNHPILLGATGATTGLAIAVCFDVFPHTLEYIKEHTQEYIKEHTQIVRPVKRNDGAEYEINQKFQSSIFDCGQTTLDMLGYDGHAMFPGGEMTASDMRSIPGVREVTVPVGEEETLDYNIPHVWGIQPKPEIAAFMSGHFVIRYKNKIYCPSVGTMDAQEYKERYIAYVFQEWVIPVKNDSTKKDLQQNYLEQPEQAPLLIRNSREYEIYEEPSGAKYLVYWDGYKEDKKKMPYLIRLTPDSTDSTRSFQLIFQLISIESNSMRTIGTIGYNGDVVVTDINDRIIGRVVRPDYSQGIGALENLLSGDFVILGSEGRVYTSNLFEYLVSATSTK